MRNSCVMLLEIFKAANLSLRNRSHNVFIPFDAQITGSGMSRWGLGLFHNMGFKHILDSIPWSLLPTFCIYNTCICTDWGFAFFSFFCNKKNIFYTYQFSIFVGILKVPTIPPNYYTNCYYWKRRKKQAIQTSVILLHQPVLISTHEISAAGRLH